MIILSNIPHSSQATPTWKGRVIVFFYLLYILQYLIRGNQWQWHAGISLLSFSFKLYKRELFSSCKILNILYIDQTLSETRGFQVISFIMNCQNHISNWKLFKWFVFYFKRKVWISTLHQPRPPPGDINRVSWLSPCLYENHISWL